MGLGAGSTAKTGRVTNNAINIIGNRRMAESRQVYYMRVTVSISEVRMQSKSIRPAERYETRKKRFTSLDVSRWQDFRLLRRRLVLPGHGVQFVQAFFRGFGSRVQRARFPVFVLGGGPLALHR